MSLIVPFDPWNNKLCTCPPKYSLSPYSGCNHGCLYCYASSYIRNFFSPRPKQNFLKKLEKEIKKIPPSSLITIANSSDPYLPIEKNLKLTQETLKILRHYDFKILIVTKSSLILRDIEILRSFKNIAISITLTTLNEKLAQELEPNAPSPKERIKAMSILSKNFPVTCRFDPLIYPLNTSEIEMTAKEVKKSGVRQIVTSTYKARADNFKRMINKFPEYKEIWYKLYFDDGGKKNGYMYLPQTLRTKLMKEVRGIALKEGMDFSSCREGLEGFNTKNCDGSSFFEIPKFLNELRK